MNHGIAEVDSRQLLTLIHNALAKVFFESAKSDAKRLYRAIADGEEAALMTLELRKSGEFACYLALDHRELAGKLNYSTFRDALAAHLHRVAAILHEEQPINLFTRHGGNDVIFHHPGVIEVNGQRHILVSGIEQRQANTLCIKLQFLDPARLEQAVAASRS